MEFVLKIQFDQRFRFIITLCGAERRFLAGNEACKLHRHTVRIFVSFALFQTIRNNQGFCWNSGKSQKKTRFVHCSDVQYHKCSRRSSGPLQYFLRSLYNSRQWAVRICKHIQNELKYFSKVWSTWVFSFEINFPSNFFLSNWTSFSDQFWP